MTLKQKIQMISNNLVLQDTIYVFKDSAPSWMTEREIITEPRDIDYEVCYRIVTHLSNVMNDNDDLAAAQDHLLSIEPDISTYDLLQWFAQSCDLSWIDDALEDRSLSAFELLQRAQWQQLVSDGSALLERIDSSKGE